MTKYNFQYHHLWLTYIFILSVSFSYLFGSIWILEIYQIELNLTYFIVSFAIFSIIIYIVLKKYFAKNGEITIFNDKIRILLGNKVNELHFSEIKTYKYTFINGVYLKFNLRNENQIRIVSSNLFCNSDGLIKFCDDFDEILINYKPTNEAKTGIDYNQKSLQENIHNKKRDKNIKEQYIETNVESQNDLNLIETNLKGVSVSDINKIPRKKKSFFESKYAMPLIIIASLLLIGLLIYALVIGKEIEASFIISIVSLFAMWSAYLNHRLK